MRRSVRAWWPAANSCSAWRSTLKTLNQFFGQTLMNYVTTSAILKWRGTAGNYWGGSGILIMRSGRAPLKGDPLDLQGGCQWLWQCLKKKKKEFKKNHQPALTRRVKMPGFGRWCSHKCWVYMVIWKWVFYLSGFRKTKQKKKFIN